MLAVVKIKARLHGGPKDGEIVAGVPSLDVLRFIDPARVTIETFWPIEAAIEYRLQHLDASRAIADYVFVAATPAATPAGLS